MSTTSPASIPRGKGGNVLSTASPTQFLIYGLEVPNTPTPCLMKRLMRDCARRCANLTQHLRSALRRSIHTLTDPHSYMREPPMIDEDHQHRAGDAPYTSSG
ncbi:hypothetical protein F4604DRAFT_1690324 [Suillus subluteus]|nr:hypothetical protein F4604DRAFT_1690324 [Suillus subluteus]